MKLIRRMALVYGLFSALCLLFIMTVPAQAAVPQFISYQGELMEDGSALSGFRSITFSLWGSDTGGDPSGALWSESQSVEVVNGIYNVELGLVSPLPADLYAHDDLFLQVDILHPTLGMQRLSPLMPINSTLFALKAAHANDADTLEGHSLTDLDGIYVLRGETGAVTSAMIADNSVGASDLAAGSVGASELGAGAVATSALADNAVTVAKLAANSVGSAQVIDNSLTAADLGTGSVGSGEVIDNSLTASDLASNSVTASEIAAGAVGSSEIADGAIAAADLADGATIAEIVDDDGSGSGLDADLLDGLHASAFMPAETDNWVNTTGDSMTGGLSIGGSGISTGVDIEIDGSTINIVGVDSSVYATEGYAQGLRIAANTGTENSRGTLGINVNANHSGTGYLHGIDIDANHYGTTGEAHGVDIYLTGSDTGDVKGVHAESRKYASDTGGTAFGAHFIGDSDRADGDAYGVLGEALAADGRCYGLYGRATQSGNADYNYGVFAEAGSTHSRSYGLLARSSQSTASSYTGYAGYFEANADADSTSAIYGIRPYVLHHGASGTSYGAAIYVSPSDTGSAYGIYSQVNSGSTTGTTYAGYFVGNVHVTGTLSKGGGSFKIDHPLDPENKYLQHSFVESPDMMNVYNGNVTLGADGQAWVDLPDYFDALNRDFRYQLTCIGGFAPVYIAEKIDGNRFQIAGGTPGLEISWQVTGIRRDAWAEANRIQVEVDKDEAERGSYLAPEAFGLDATRSVEYARDPEMMESALKRMERSVE